MTMAKMPCPRQPSPRLTMATLTTAGCLTTMATLMMAMRPTTLMRTTVDENRQIGAEIARKTAASTGPSVILLPLDGVSAIDKEGQPFDDPAAREALFAAIREHHGDVELVELPHHINDAEFAKEAALRLMKMIENC
ncbi:MAG: Tm-1-like ATP-binding domain-containing protein [Chloroflexi bacterium]|nr:Tm-1-like ATP-binding domain-containing protein [Chloroflexota bacterium]